LEYVLGTGNQLGSFLVRRVPWIENNKEIEKSY
jgi:hypothetical protein